MAAPLPYMELPFHSDVDVGAVGYSPGEPPDAVLEAFLTRRLGEGWDAVGLLQSRNAEGARRDLSFKVVPDGGRAYMIASGAADGVRCSDALAPARRTVAAALVRRPDLVVLNRFGRAEAEGCGLHDLIAAILDRGIPLLIAVPHPLLPVWFARGAGMAVRLSAEMAHLEHWWRSLGPGTAERPQGRFCERHK